MYATKKKITTIKVTLLTRGLFLIFLALSAYLRVVMVSSTLLSAGDTQAIIKVCELLPEKDPGYTRYGFSRVSLSGDYFALKVVFTPPPLLFLDRGGKYA